MKAIFDFVGNTCSLTGKVVTNDDKTVSVVVSNGTGTPQEVLTCYAKHGMKCMEHLGGVCAFCLWDEKKKVLLASRDRIGEKTLYFTQLPTSVVVSSELKDLIPYLAHPTISMLNLAQPIRYNFPIDLQQTWIEQIHRVRAGEYLLIDKDGIQSGIYWARNHKPTFKGTKKEALSNALQLLRASVKQSVNTANGPVAILLSGGIDSTSLAALTKEIQQEVHVISAGYKGNIYTACDERSDAKRFAEEKGLIYHEVELDAADFEQALYELMPYLDEPCFDVSCMAQYMLYKKAAEMGFKVILSGLGGDEQFYSYAGHHREVEALQLRRKFNELYPIGKHKKQYLQFIMHHWKYMLLPTMSAKISEAMLTEWTYKDYKSFTKDAVLNGQRFDEIDEHVSFPENITIQGMYDYLTATFAVNMCVYLGNILCNANDIELRCPFLSPELVSFLDSLPMEMKFDISQPKRFQKEMMSGIVPDFILYARKRGFEPPFEFIRQIASKYQYKHIKATHCFYNSMIADRLIEQQL